MNLMAVLTDSISLSLPQLADVGINREQLCVLKFHESSVIGSRIKMIQFNAASSQWMDIAKALPTLSTLDRQLD